MRRLTIGTQLALMALVVWLVPSSAVAQNTGIAGVVKDATGAVLPGVTVEASSPALIERVRSVVTDGQGLFSIVDLRPGTYTVTFSLAGFSTIKREGIELTASFTATVNAELKVGAVEETLTVTGEAPNVDTHNVVQLKVLDDETREQLPNGRSILFMALTIPGISNTGGIRGTGVDVVGASDTRGQSFIHGGRSGDYRMELDGAQLNTTAIQPNPNNTQEFVYELGALSAETEQGGVRANIIPKEGGNRYTASFLGTYIPYQSDNLNATLIAQGIPKPNKILFDRDVNGSGGGPIRKDKLWFYSSYRYFAHKEEVIGMYFAIDPRSFVFNPALGAAGNVDLNRPAYNEAANYWYDNRLTWQATPRNKFAFFLSEQPRHTHGTFVTGTRSMEAGRSQFFNRNDLIQGTWKSPVTPRLLIEASFTQQHQIGPQGEPDFLPGWASSDIVAVTDTGTGYTYRASSTGYTYTYTHQPSMKAAVSYVTGGHTAKVGVVYEWGLYNETGLHHNLDENFTFKNGAPSQITVFNEPYSQRPEYSRWGVFAQDQWTLKRLTLNAGLRLSRQRDRTTDQQTTGPNPYAPFQTWAAVENVPNWKDVSPRFGAAYDLFGTGKTALKYTLSRYVVGDTNPPFSNQTTVNPIFFNLSATRSWNDQTACAGGVPRDFVPQECELGTLSNPAFGTAIPTTHLDDAIRQGWFVRPYDWETSIGVQHQLLPQIALNFAFTRRSYSNFTATDNLALIPGDYDQFCINAPVDARLGGASGAHICGLYDLNPAKRSLTPNNLVTKASTFGTQTETYKGIDLNLNARLPHHATVSGGLNMGPQRNNTSACFVIDSPGALRFCDVNPVWKATLRFIGNVEMPYGVNTGISFQSIPGPEILADYALTNTDIASGNVQFVNPARTTFGSGSATVALIAPGTQYNDRLYQVDIRVTKTIAYRGIRGRFSVDFGNLFNVSTILQNSTTYGTSWLRPNNILPGRIIKPGFQLEF